MQVIINHEYLHIIPPSLNFSQPLTLFQWYKYPECTSRAGLTLYLNTSRVLFYNPVCYCKAKPGTCLFCGKERVKYKRQVLLGYPFTCVLYLEHCGVIFNVRLYKYHTVAAHSLNSIFQYIKQGFFHPVRIYMHLGSLTEFSDKNYTPLFN